MDADPDPSMPALVPKLDVFLPRKSLVCHPPLHSTKSYVLQTIVKTLGFSNIITLLITAPVYVFGFISALGNSLIANRTSQRAVLIAWPL